MHENYADILSKVPTAPMWYDQNGAPRYDEFQPQLCPDVYSNAVGLFLITCQGCGRAFHVELHTSVFDRLNELSPRAGHYGDPPRHKVEGQGCVGESMNCNDQSVLQ